MWLIAGALVLVILLFLLGRAGRDNCSSGEANHDKAGCDTCSACNGIAGMCIHDRVFERSVAQPEYFDDEELDEFKGRSSDSYSETEIEMFAEVLFTMKPEEVKDWLESLSLRQIELPDALKDEAFMLMEG